MRSYMVLPIVLAIVVIVVNAAIEEGATIVRIGTAIFGSRA
ncbi:MAG: hypothetical protein AB1656_10080 [Candidatus Omnitrophota bacterium]